MKLKYALYNITKKNNKFLIELDSELMSQIAEVKLKPVFLFIEKQSKYLFSNEDFLKQLLEKTDGIQFCNKDYQKFGSVLNC